MSTRAQVIVKDSYEEVWFYRHSDGYPKGTLPTLAKFLKWVSDGLIRKDASQSAGWLVIIGHTEYNVPDEPDQTDVHYNWKVGAYEPCAPNKHGDIEYLYTIDVEKLTVTVQKVYYDELKGWAQSLGPRHKYTLIKLVREGYA